MLILGIDPGMAETGWGIIKKSKVAPSPRRRQSLWRRTAKRLGRVGDKSRAAGKAFGDARQKSKVHNGLTLVDYGCIKTSIDHNLPQRLLTLKKELQKIIIEHKPDCLAIEQLFFGRNAKTAMIVGLARGVMMVTSAEEKVPVFEYQGLSVKLDLSGDGRCSKKGMQNVVKKILRLNFIPRPQHAADALAVAIYHASERGRTKDETPKKKR